MGRDKALLPDAQHGNLLQRQLTLLAAIEPAEMLVSCRAGQELPSLPSAVKLVFDTGADGPLGGVAALLEQASGDRLLVIAVDLGALTQDFLRALVAKATATSGIVPRSRRGLEPLAAIYPTRLAASARSRLARGGDLSLQGFLQHALDDGTMRAWDVPDDAEGVLANWNTPEDVPGRA